MIIEHLTHKYQIINNLNKIDMQKRQDKAFHS